MATDVAMIIWATSSGHTTDPLDLGPLCLPGQAFNCLVWISLSTSGSYISLLRPRGGWPDPEAVVRVIPERSLPFPTTPSHRLSLRSAVQPFSSRIRSLAFLLSKFPACLGQSLCESTGTPRRVEIAVDGAQNLKLLVFIESCSGAPVWI